MADTLDLLTLTEGKAAINMAVTNPDHEDEVAQQITAVSRLIDAACGPVVQRTVTELHDGGTPTLLLLQPPVSSITTIREAEGGAVTSLSVVPFGGTTDGYSVDLDSGRVSRRTGGSVRHWGRGVQVEVVYVAGRYASTAAVDARFKTCAASILRRLWKREAGTWAQSSDFFQQQDPSDGVQLGFFRVARPIIDEMLWDELVPPGVA